MRRIVAGIERRFGIGPLVIPFAWCPCETWRASWLSREELVSAVLVMNVLLFIVTVHRYFAGDWRLAWSSLPWEA